MIIVPVSKFLKNILKVFDMKIKLVHLINFLSPAGKEIGIVKLLNGLDPDKFDTTLIVIDKVFETLNLDTDKTRLIELNKQKGNDIRMPFKLSRLFKSERYDIVHTHAWGTLVEGVLAAKLAKVPVIIHGEHGTFHKDFKRKYIQKFFFNRADYLLSVSDVLAKEITETIGLKEHKFRTILNGVDVDKFSPDPAQRSASRSELNFDEKDFIFGTVGRPKEVKNQQLMIHALQKILPKYPRAHFVIIGDTPLNSMVGELKSLAEKLGVSGNVHFLGTREDIPRYLNAFDSFVLPSLREGCSNVLQEAMASGIPVAASNVGGNPELVIPQETGLLFDVHDLDSFVSGLEFLIENPQIRNQFAQNARNRAVSEFSLEHMVTQYSDLYREVMNNSH